MRLEGLAAAARAAATEHRIALNAEATAEYEREGMAPTWRWPDIGTIILPVSKEAATVQNAAALVEWCSERYPTEVETLSQIRPAFQAALMKRAVIDGSSVVDPVTGEIMPGLAVRPGGIAKALTIRPTPDAEALFAAVGRQMLDDLLAPAGGAE